MCLGQNPIDQALSSGNHHGVEIIRYILRCTPQDALTTDQRTLLGDINWGLRREAMLVSSATIASYDYSNYIAHLRSGCYGVWREILSYL
jgi:hypothetical protein